MIVKSNETHDGETVVDGVQKSGDEAEVGIGTVLEARVFGVRRRLKQLARLVQLDWHWRQHLDLAYAENIAR